MSVYYTLCFLAALAIFIAFANQYVVKIQTTIAITAGSMLISALMGREEALRVYNIAVEEKYRFFSFGDAMLIL